MTIGNATNAYAMTKMLFYRNALAAKNKGMNGKTVAALCFKSIDSVNGAGKDDDQER